jgi:replicative DNA helicase
MNTNDTTHDVVEKLAAIARPRRLEKYTEKRGIVRDDDVICTHCLDQYKEQANCEFSPNCYLTSDIQLRHEEGLDDLEEADQAQFQILHDPISWALWELEWSPRWYQIAPMRCSARKKIFRMGRQIGKTEILAILALYHVATKPNFRVVVLCPYQDQVDLIFERIRNFIQRSELLSDREFKIRDKMNPHEIVFYHPEGRSSMIGITAGVRTGQKGDKARGQTPNLLIIDEADMLDDETLEAILAMLTGVGEVAQMVVSSTPTGRRGLYFKWCTNKRMDFKEFYFPSKVSPNWTPEIELFYRESYSENGYAHEFDAEFGEMEVGVFQHTFIESSLKVYSVLNTNPTPGELYSMGVDWNRKGKGVHIIVTGYNPVSQEFRVALKEIVDPSEFVQLKAIRRVADLNEKWDPEFIYVDHGDGDTQIEALQMYGLQHPESRLHRKVVPVDFGSKVVVRDPLTKGFVKKHVKPFMVDLCVRRMEMGMCTLPRSEDNSNGLVGQMRDYTVVRYGRDGQKIYKDEGEHTLVAWMLSIYGVIMELSDIAKVTHDTTVVHVGPLGHSESLPLIDQQEMRKFREKQKRVSPQSRVPPSPQMKARLQPLLEGLHGGKLDMSGLSLRSKIGKLNRAGPGHFGRPSWRDGKGNRRSSW